MPNEFTSNELLANKIQYYLRMTVVLKGLVKDPEVKQVSLTELYYIQYMAELSYTRRDYLLIVISS